MQDKDHASIETISNNYQSTDEKTTKTSSEKKPPTTTRSKNTNYGTIVTNISSVPSSNINPVIPSQTSTEVEEYNHTRGGDDNNTPNQPPTEEMRASLNFFEKIGYGLGHVFNDLSAGVWFSYTLLFLQGVLKMEGTMAGALVMMGQVGDAIATPIAGYFSDRYGTKRKWHILGIFA